MGHSTRSAIPATSGIGEDNEYTEAMHLKSRLVKFILIFIALAIAAFIVFVYIAWNGTPWGSREHHTKMMNYLEAKYQEKFVISTPKYNPLSEVYGANAHPASKPGISFWISQKYDSDDYHDDYALEVWKDQLKSDVEAKVKEIYPKSASLSAEIQISDPTADLSPKAPILSYRDAKLPESDIFVLHIHMTEDLSSFAYNDEVLKLKSMGEYLKQEKIPAYIEASYGEGVKEKFIFLRPDGTISNKG